MARYHSGRADPAIAQRLKRARQNAGFTQPQVSVKIGRSIGAICDWECGRTEPVLSELKTLCALYNVSADSILGPVQVEVAA